jgi:hypothetical protein
MNTQELLILMDSIERSISLIGEKPNDGGFERQVFEELSRMRDMLRQAHPELFSRN